MTIATGIYNTLNRMNTDTNRLNFERGRENLGKTTLDKNAFMQLLLAKLQNQDPLSPEDNGEFLTQQAQMAQMESMENLSKTNAITQVSSLVGKKVDIKDAEGNIQTGIVNSAKVSESGEVGIEIGNSNFKLNQISKIYGSTL